MSIYFGDKTWVELQEMIEKGTIVFLPVPASLGEKLRHFSPSFQFTESCFRLGESSFTLEPSIPIPVELEPGENKPDPEKISLEMILSGMLRTISARGQDHSDIPPEWVDYYRRFVLTVKPEIYHEFTSATIIKAGNGEFDLALEISAVLEGLFPRSPGVLLNKAIILEQKAIALEKNGHRAEKENSEALDAYETALSLEPILPDTLFNAGHFFKRRRDFARAKDNLSRFLTLDEESEIPVEITNEKKKQAKQIIHDINNQGLDDESFQEAYDFISCGNNEKGLLKIREFIQKHPTTWNGWFILGWALRKLGRYSDSLESFKKAEELRINSELNEAHIDIENEMAICLMELGDIKGAKKKLEQALSKEPENIKIISNLGVLAQKAGNRDEAAAFFRIVLELDPDDSLAKHFLSEWA